MYPLKTDRRHLWALAAILLLATIVRFAALDSVPAGMNQDEAFAGYEAWSILHYGTDSHGYRFPVYLTAWGSGMNALYSYLSIPFIALLGATKLAIRLPQAIFGSLTVAVAYGLGREVRNRRFGLVFAGLLAICPWHIMLSRWGLESNLVVFFLAAGMFCFLRGLGDRRWLVGWAVCYALGLYCYATVWMVAPILLVLELIYGFRRGRLRWRDLLWPGVILCVLALPLLLFVAVNLGWLPEIRTPVLSVPKLLYMRAGEYDPTHIPQHFYLFFRLLVDQSDGLLYNASAEFGLFYKFSLPLICCGFAAILMDARAQRHQPLAARQDKAVCLLFHLVALVPTVLLLHDVNVNRVNSLHLALVFCCAYGVERLAGLVPYGLGAFLTAYALSFLAFAGSYFYVAPPAFSPDIDGALDQAVLVAEADQTVYVADCGYPNVLFALEYPTDEYVAAADFSNYPSAFLRLRSVGRWRFDPDPGALKPGAVYLCRDSNAPLIRALETAGWTGQVQGDYLLYIPN